MKIRFLAIALAMLTFALPALAAVNATSVFRARPSGNNLNGGGYDPGIAGAGTDYSQQNAAQTSGVAGTATGTTTFSDAGAAFTAAMIGNSIWIASGAGFTSGLYFVTGFTSATQVTLDRSPGTGSAASWRLGGGWRDFWTNTAANIVPGNIVYVLGTGIPTTAGYATPDYTATTNFTSVSGSAAAGFVTYAADPLTPSYNGTTTGGMPLVSAPGLFFFNSSVLNVKLLWIFASNATVGGILADIDRGYFDSLVIDQNGWNVNVVNAGLNGETWVMINSEVFSSIAARGATGAIVISSGQYGARLTWSNIHDCIGPAVSSVLTGVMIIDNNIIVKNNGNGITVIDPQGVNFWSHITNNTIDGNLGHGIAISTQALGLQSVSITGNIISNHIVAAKAGLTVLTGTTAVNDRIKQAINFNTYYNNTADVTAISYGPNDVHGGSNPYAGQTTENYAVTVANVALGNPAFSQHLAGQTTGVQNNAVPGAVQPAQSAGSGGGVLIGGF